MKKISNSYHYSLHKTHQRQFLNKEQSNDCFKMTWQAEEIGYLVAWMLAQISSQPINYFAPGIQKHAR